MSKDVDWDLCRSFLAVVREGSLSGAARALALTQPTVGRHIETLETRLGVVLFTRWQHGLNPTETALDLVPHVEAMRTAAEALVRAASGQAKDERGTVRLTASEVVGAEVLPPILASFRSEHPGIVIELVLSNRNEDLLKREADIAVRMVRPQQSGLVARLIGQTPVSLYAHRTYADRHALPRTLAELMQHPIIGYDGIAWPTNIAKIGDVAITRDIFSLRTDSDLAQLAALRAGYGIGGCQDALARQDRDLIAVMPDMIRFDLPMWLVMHEDLRSSRRVRLLYDFLAGGLATYLRPAASGPRSGTMSGTSPSE
jgi:DNA-binding transcriptional LysR family regulator